MQVLVIYCYANSEVSTRRIEREIARCEAVSEKMRWVRAEPEKQARGGKEPPEDGSGPTAGASEPLLPMGQLRAGQQRSSGRRRRGQSFDPGHGSAVGSHAGEGDQQVDAISPTGS